MPLNVGGVCMDLEGIRDAEVNQTTEQTRFERDTIEARGKKQIYWANVEGERTKDHYNRGPGERHEEGQQADDARKGIEIAAVGHQQAAQAGLICVDRPVGAVFGIKLGSEQSVRTARK